MPDYQKMTDAEFYVECADVVHHLCTQLTTIAWHTASISRTNSDAAQQMATAVLEFSMLPMLEGLGDILNEMDAPGESDEWTNPIYEELQRRFPRPEAPDQLDVSDSIDPAGDEAASGGEADL